MAMPATAGRWTAEMVRALPDDGKRYEVIAGELLVTPAPRPQHQEILCRLVDHLRPYLRVTGAPVHAFFSPADISWDEDTLVQPGLLETRRLDISQT